MDRSGFREREQRSEDLRECSLPLALTSRSFIRMTEDVVGGTLRATNALICGESNGVTACEQGDFLFEY